MEKRLWSFLAVCLMAVSMAFAQQKVTGVVIESETGEPVVGASVVVMGSNGIGAATDINGRFTINNVPNSAKHLMVSYIGMVTAEVSIKPNLKIYLKSDSQILNEQMVVAYGTQSKASFTGAAVTVKGEDIQKVQTSSVERALEGAVAGVQLTSSTNTPGSSASLIIRGIGSISSSQEPLIVMDGVPYEGSLNSINPKDIATLTVLKDAAANSMYGARGSNGVIMITTKSGGRGKARIDFDARLGWNTRGVSSYDIITDAGEWYEMMWESYRNTLVGRNGYAVANAYATENLINIAGYNKFKGIADNAIVGTDGKLNPAASQYKWGDNWSKDPFKSKLRQEYNVSVSGGNEKTQAYVSMGYLKDKGYVVGSGFERYSGRVKVDQIINDYIKVGGNIAYSRTDQKSFGDEESNYSNLFFFSQSIAPIYPIYFYDAAGNRALNNAGGIYDFGTEYQRPYAAESNPYGQAKSSIYQELVDNFSSRGYLEVKLPYGFKVTGNIAYDLFNDNETDFVTPIGGDAYSFGGRGYKYATRHEALNANQLIDWNQTYGNHKVHVLLGHENKKDNYRYLYGHKTNFADKTNPELANATVYQGLSSYTWEYALEGVFAKGEYDYLDRYYFTASVRRDGSSRFASGNRWGTFWAMGAAWRIKEESWMQDIKEINDLKIKASYGTQGNDNVGYLHNYTDLYRVDPVNDEASFTKVNRGNKDLTWEKSRNFNIGFESKFLNRFSLDFDFFIKETRDLLYASPLSPSLGSPSSIYRNEMNMKNTGIEFTLSADVLQFRDFNWNISLNGTHYKNKLTKLPDSKPADLYPDGYQAGSYWRSIGGSLYDWYLYEYVGVDPETGKALYNAYDKYTQEEWDALTAEEKAGYLDYNGKEARYYVNSASATSQRRTGKSALPTFVGGISTSINYMGFDLSIQTAFSLGGWTLDSQYAGLMNSGAPGQNFHKDMFNRWTPANTDTNIPALMYQDRNEYSIEASSTFFLTRSNYFNLRNITFGYTFPKTWLSSVGIEKLRVYFSGDNIWLRSKRKGFDPRQSFDGTTGYNYSMLSSYSFGINLSF